MIAWTPNGRDPSSQKQFNIDWSELVIAWTIAPPTMLRVGTNKRPINYFSMLPYGWIPDNEVELVQHFIMGLKEQWMKLCESADVHLSKPVSSLASIENLSFVCIVVDLTIQ
jgi:hypothetical protein